MGLHMVETSAAGILISPEFASNLHILFFFTLRSEAGNFYVFININCNIVFITEATHIPLLINFTETNDCTAVIVSS